MILIPINSFGFIENCPTQRVTLNPGVYFIEAWGASGGGDYGGKGAYTAGKLKLHNITTFEIVVGGQGNPSELGPSVPKGGCNGGGNAGAGAFNSGKGEYYNSGSGGGGSTDLKLSTSSKTDKRILVSGAGGGSAGAIHAKGGSAGGVTGLSSEPFDRYAIVSKGADENGYASGQGQNGRNGTNVNCGGEGNGGGGGGWNGGYSSQDSGNWTNAGGGGGSSYISGHPDCIKHPDIQFLKTIMKTGNDMFLSPYGESFKGHTGNGFLKISVYSSITCQQFYSKIYSPLFVSFFIFQS